MDWIDLSLPLMDGMPVYPGDPPVLIEQVLRHDRDGIQLSRLSLGSHTGTHVDVPRHFLADGAAVDQLPLERFCCEALVLACPSSGGVIDLAQADWQRFRPGDALLLATGWADRWNQPGYFGQAPAFAAGSTSLLLQLGIRLLGIDLPTLVEQQDPPDPAAMHVGLLSAGVVIVENLINLQLVTGRRVAFQALPLRLEGCDGSPVRACACLIDD
jgi:arylformamidase